MLAGIGSPASGRVHCGFYVGKQEEKECNLMSDYKKRGSDALLLFVWAEYHVRY